MNRENRRREATHAIWHQSYETWRDRPEAERQTKEVAINALLAVLRETCDTQEELHERYWEPGDWPAPVLLRQLPEEDPGQDELLTLEEAAFWLRYLELTGQDR